MRRNYIVRLLILLLAVLSFAACSSKEGNKTAVHQHDAASHQYTCPMHPQVVQDKLGTCPICNMDLVLKNSKSTDSVVDTSLTYLLKPVNEQIVASIPVIKASSGSKVHTLELQGRITYDTRNQTSISSRVSGRIERLYTKYNYQPVKKGQLIMKVYSPDLAAAQRELLFINRTGNEENMLQGAKQRLILLGMGEQQIAKVLRTGKVSYSVPVYSNADGYILEQTAASAASSAPVTTSSSSSASLGGGMDNMSGSSSSNSISSGTAPTSTPVLIREGQYVNAGQTIFTIYRSSGLVAEFSLNPQTASQIKKNAKLLIHRVGNTEETFPASVGLIQPAFNVGENFTVARVYISNKSLKAGELIVGHIPIVTEKGSWLPEKAVVSLGNKSVVFKKEGKVFVPREISIGIKADKDIQVMTDISTWEVAKNAYFMIDSESFIKAQDK